MIRLRPYKPCDAESIVSWCDNETVFNWWGGLRFGWVIVDSAKRGRQYGKKMLRLGFKIRL